MGETSWYTFIPQCGILFPQAPGGQTRAICGSAPRAAAANDKFTHTAGVFPIERRYGAGISEYGCLLFAAIFGLYN